MKSIYFLMILTLFGHMALAEDLPKWVKSPEKGCKKRELCVVGEATGMMMANTNARKALAAFFKVQIKSTFKATTEVDVAADSVEEELSEGITEITDEILEGVEIRENYHGDSTVYSLAVLDKRKAAKKIERAIKEIDDKMKTMATANNGRLARGLKKLHQQRIPLNDRYAFLMDREIKAPYSYQQIHKLVMKSVAGVVLFVDIKEMKKDVEKIVVDALSKDSFKIVKGSSNRSKATHYVTGKFSCKQEYMKVEGFQKQRCTLDISAENKKGQKTGVFQFTTVETGRDSAQAYAKAIGQVQEYIKGNISELNID